MRFKQNFAFSCFLLLVAAQAGKAGALVTFAPVNTTGNAGSVLDLSVVISGAWDLYAWQLDVAFSPSVISAQNQTEGVLLMTGGSTTFLPGTIDNSGGTIVNIGATLDNPVAGVSGAGSLLDLQFLALAPGTSGLSIANIILLDSQGSDIPFTTGSGTVTVFSPEPATFVPDALVLIGMAGFLPRLRTRRE
jgi:hypothetical protein